MMLATLTACMVVYAFPPQQYSFYPACAFHRLTGLLCPGCGATRALHALLRGELFVAADLNPLLVSMLPVILAVAGWQLISVARSGRFAPVNPGNRTNFAMLAVMTAFTMTRNHI
jgi:hypothetical protein